MATSRDKSSGRRQEVFVSYAREDAEQISALDAELSGRGITLWRDTAGLRAGERWRRAVERAISRVDLVVFALTPDSARSGPCAWELATAIEMGKLVVTLRLADLPDADVPEQLGDRQWILSEHQDDVQAAAASIEQVLRTNFAALDQHARIAAATVEWEVDQRRDILLRGAGLRDAERWITASTESFPQASQQQRAFIARSRRASRVRRALALCTVLVLLVIAGFGVRALIARDQENRDRQQLEAVTALLDQADGRRDSDPTQALRLVIAAERIRHTSAGEASLTSLLTTTHLAHQVTGLEGPVNSVALNADGTLLAGSGGQQEKILLWDVTDPTDPQPQPAELTGRGANASALLFAPGRFLVGIGTDSILTVWALNDPAHPRIVSQKQLSGPGSALALRADGLLAVGELSRVSLWRLGPDGALAPSGMLTGPFFARSTIGIAYSVNGLAFSPDGATLAVSNDLRAALWDVRTPTAPRQLSPELISSVGKSGANAVAFAGDGTTLVVGAGSGIARWDVSVPTAPVRLTPEHGPITAPVDALAWASRANRMLVGGDDGVVTDLVPGNRTLPPLVHGTMRVPGGSVASVAVSETGQTGASGTADGQITLWTLDYRAVPNEVSHFIIARNLGGSVSDLAAGPDGTALVGDDNGVVSDWDLTTASAPRRVPGADLVEKYAIGQVSTATPAGLIAVNSAETMHLWSIGPSGAHSHAEMATEDFSSDHPQFLPSQDRLVVGGAGGELVVWDVKNPDAIPPPTVSQGTQRGQIISLAVSSNGNTVAMGSIEGDIALWNVGPGGPPTPLGKPLLQNQGQTSALTFSHDDRLMVSGADNGSVLIWDVSNRQSPRVVSTLPSGTAVSDLALSNDGRILVVARDGSDPHGHTTTTLWDLGDETAPKQLGPGLLTTESRSSLLLLSGGAVLLVSDGPSVRVFDLTALNTLRRNAVDLACRIVGQGLQADQWAQVLKEIPYQQTC